jgi:branched-chain amino acid transport system permease protein
VKALRARVPRHVSVAVPLLIVLVFLPYSAINVPGLFDGPFDSAGTLQLLALCLVFAGLALGYDLLFGRTGLLSFGHGLFVTIGVYATVILVDQAGLGLPLAALIALAVGVLLALALGAVALRVSGIAFAMVTLAFAQAVSILVISDPHNLTGGEQGSSLNANAVPSALAGIANTVNLYWLALGYAAFCAVVVWWAYGSVPGQVWRGIRDNEQRVEVLGLNPYVFKLLAFVLAAVLATGGGIIYLLLVGGASADVSTSNFTLALLVMVVLGGSGSRWGPIIGGMLYTYLQQTLTRVSDSTAVSTLPGVVRGPLEQPLFILGVVFVLVVFFVPGGVGSLSGRISGLIVRRRTDDPALSQNTHTA